MKEFGFGKTGVFRMKKMMKQVIAILLAIAWLVCMAGVSFAEETAEIGAEEIIMTPAPLPMPEEENAPVLEPTETPTDTPTEAPTVAPTLPPTPEETATATPTQEPTETPTEIPTEEATLPPTPEPTETAIPTQEATEEATLPPTPEITANPTADPSPIPTQTPAPDAIASFAIGDANVRLAPNGLSDILLTIPDGTPLLVLGIEGDWAQVDVAGVIGYLFIDSVAGFAPKPEEEAKAEPKVTLFSSRRAVMVPGETVYLTCKLENLDGYELRFQWQCDAGAGFVNIEGATGDSHSFAASAETLAYDWQLLVYYRLPQQ
jgi:hypothetical protein